MVSKMIADENIKPHFMYREKRTRSEDSGWRIFTGLETEEYNADPNNTGIYNPSTILKIDASIAPLLLKGVGSVYERTDENSDWYAVDDFEMEDNFMTVHKLTQRWSIEINNLFERRVEESGDLFYTTGDKSVRIAVWNDDNDRQTLQAEHHEMIENRDQTDSKTLQKFDFSDADITRLGYWIEENDDDRTYGVLHGFSIIDQQIVQVTLYFDDQKDLVWAIETWKNIRLEQ